MTHLYVGDVTLAPATEPGSWQNPTPSWLADLPTETSALRARLYADAQGHGTTPDGEVFVLIADALRSQRVPAHLRSAMFEVLQTVGSATHQPAAA